jgi:hypothetical protein
MPTILLLIKVTVRLIKFLEQVRRAVLKLGKARYS